MPADQSGRPCQLGEGAFWFEVAGCREAASVRCHCLPDSEGARTQKSMMLHQVAYRSEKILDNGMEGEELLGLTSGFESANMPFSLTGRLMRDFGPIVGVAFWVVRDFA